MGASAGIQVRKQDADGGTQRGGPKCCVLRTAAKIGELTHKRQVDESMTNQNRNINIHNNRIVTG
jgi:hypothetical protein